MIKKILFLLTFLLTTLGGGNFALAEEVYSVTSDGSNVNTSSGSLAFATGTTFQATSSVAMYIGSGWGITSADITGNASPKYGSTDWDYNNATNLPNAGAYLIFTPSANGTFIFKGTKNGKNGVKYLTITTAVNEYVENAIVKFNGGSPINYQPDRVGYSLPDTKKGNYSSDSKTPFTAEFSVIAHKTYYVFVQTFSSWSFTGFTFRPQENYTTQIPINYLRYRSGISASNGMDRSVGGFNLTFTEARDGIKCNDTNKLIFRSKYQSGSSTWNQGKMTIALDANNSNKTISEIELIYADNSLSASNINVSSGNLTDDTSNNKLVWTGSASSVTFTANYTADIGQTPAANITQINITTSAQPTFTKVTPTLVFPDTEIITTSDSKTINLEASSTVTPDNFLFDVSFVDGETGVTHTNDNSLGTITATSGDTSAGVASVIASFSGNDFFNSVGSSFSLIVNGQNSKTYSFIPNEIYLNLGKNITPYINYSQSDFDKSGLTFNAYPSDVVSLETVDYQKEKDRKLCKISVNNDLAKAGKTVVVTAKCKIKDSDPEEYCYASLKVHIKAEGSRNFEWMGPADYYINKGDYMFIPGIIGNSSGNNSYSKASNNETYQSYVYKIDRSSKTITWWRNDGTEKYYKIDEGCPDYRIVENTPNVDNDVAYIFWNTGQGGDGIDTLMIYGNKAGEATLRAFDPQDHNIYTNVTIHVKDPDATEGVNKLNTTYVNNMTFPYTWDFTKNFSDLQLEKANPLYWEKKGDSYSMGIASSFNYDYADENGDGQTSNNDNNDKLFSDGSALIPQLYGLKISLGNSSQGSWFSKRDRLRLNPSAGDGKPHLQIIGGSHKLYLPAPPIGSRPGETYKLLLKVKANGKDARIIFNGGTASSMDVLYLVDGKDKDGKVVLAGTTKTFAGKDYEHKSSDWLKDAIFSYTVQRTENISLQLNNLDVYWIAFSTEEKTLNYPKTITYGGNSVTTGVTYAANTYSYNEDLDIVKSSEANQGVTAYYASNFTVDKDAAASSTGEGTQYAVKMTPANSLEYVTKNTGLLLKKNVTGDAAQTVSCYMIANPRNVESYSADDKIVGKNYLMGTGANSATVTGWKDGNTNFLMAYAYKYYTNLSDPNSAQGDYRFDRNWSFYPAMDEVTVPAQRAYLQVPQNVYVDREGNIVNMPSGSRSHRSGDTAEAPATKAMLSIVFDDEPHGGDSGETTGINTVSERNNDSDAWFTLQGVRVNAPAKGGIYIHKGRKFVVK